MSNDYACCRRGKLIFTIVIESLGCCQVLALRSIVDEYFTRISAIGFFGNVVQTQSLRTTGSSSNAMTVNSFPGLSI